MKRILPIAITKMTEMMKKSAFGAADTKIMCIFAGYFIIMICLANYLSEIRSR